MEKQKFYLSTAIAYTSSVPHIGNVYETILSDSIARFKRLEGYDVYFQTGTDEHGQKIEEKAKQAGIEPQQFVDGIANEIKRIYKLMNISYDKFVRTTDKDHEAAVQQIFKKLYEQGDIYKGHYEGLYCKYCESFYTEKELVDGKCPDCNREVKKTQEEAYFLKLEKYQERLVEHIKNNPDFIFPESRKNEMLNNFLKDKLPDLCVSRTSFKWGIPVDFDNNHVVYVWIDALSNYITGIGYNLVNPSDKFKKYWPCDVHVIGKDILRFHTIYWPIMLMALGIELPKQIFAHPWVLFGKEKMSKSKGNILYTDDLVNLFGVDQVRYYCLHEIPYQADGNMTYELLIERVNSDLVNTLSNLVNRTLAMSDKYFSSILNNTKVTDSFDEDLINLCLNTKQEVADFMNQYKVTDALESVMKLVRRANKYIDETEPWVLFKNNNLDRLQTVIYNLIEAIRFSAVLLQSFIPETSDKIFNLLNTNLTSFDTIKQFGLLENGHVVKKQEVIFQRLDVNLKKKEIEEYYKAKEPVVVEEVKTPSKPEITIDDFDKVEIKVGEVLQCEKHPKADRLLVSQIKIGNEVRQIVSGIAKYYKPEEMVGKKVLVVTNLKKVVLRGVESNGMVLCASDENNLEVLEAHKSQSGFIVK
jgi:methionyl-tRNA synthetase